MKKAFYLLLSILSIILIGCAEDDSFSSDSNLKLEFSSDTIRFDTVFTTIGSATKQFKIYNNNKKALRVESIKLMHPTQSGFRINIDGESGDLFNNIEISKKDSLHAFIEVTVDPLNQNNPVTIRDSIQFLVNGNIQYLQLEAIGQDVHIWRAKEINQNMTLTNDKPYLIYDSLVIKAASTLQIDPGCQFFFHHNASLQVYGTLKATGSFQKPITMRGDRFGYVENDILYDNMPSQWRGIVFHNNSFDNELNNVIIRNTNDGVVFNKSTTSQQKATLLNSVFHNSAANCLKAINCKIDAINCQFSNSKKSTVEIVGGRYNITYCTIANYFRWSSRTDVALSISNKPSPDENLIPLAECNVINSIVYGTMSNETSFTNGDTSNNANVFEYQFSNCLLRSKEVNDNHYSFIIWNRDPLFKDINSAYNYSYNFELRGGSPAIDKGDDSVAIPYDIKGNTRPFGIASDLGCFESQGE